METHQMHYWNGLCKPWTWNFKAKWWQNSQTATHHSFSQKLWLSIISIHRHQHLAWHQQPFSCDFLRDTSGTTSFSLHFGCCDSYLQKKSWKVGGCRGTVCAGGDSWLCTKPWVSWGGSAWQNGTGLSGQLKAGGKQWDNTDSYWQKKEESWHCCHASCRGVSNPLGY